MNYIVPRNKAHGVDICGCNDCFYIIRSDIGVFMSSDNLNTGSDIEIIDLHDSCKGGDHYLATGIHFYIIKGNSYRRVMDMATDEDSIVYQLHPNCQGGDHYLSMSDKFYIIFKDKGIYRRTTNMSKDENPVEYRLHSSNSDGLYYWGNGENAYLFKPGGEWGVEYHETSNMNNNSDSNTYSFAKDVVTFLPGGLATAKGATIGKWEVVKNFSNSSKVDVEWSEEVSHRMGANRTELSSIEHNWNVKISSKFSAGILTEQIAKAQFSLDVSFGGKSVKTSTQNWKEMTTVTEKVSLKIPAGESFSLWQYQLGFGDNKLLFCRKMKLTKSNDSPTDSPLESTLQGKE